MLSHLLFFQTMNFAFFTREKRILQTSFITLLGNKYELWIDEIFSSHHFSSSSPNFILIGFSKFIGAPFLSILLLRQRSLTSRSLGRSNRTFTWRGRELELPSPLSDKLRWRVSFNMFYIGHPNLCLKVLYSRPTKRCVDPCSRECFYVR